MATARQRVSPFVYGSGGLMPSPYIDRSPLGRGRTNNRLIRGPKVDIIPMYGLEVNPLTQDGLGNAMTAKNINYKWTHDHNTAAQGNVVLPKGHMVSFDQWGLLNYADLDAAGPNAQQGYVTGLSYLNLFRPVRDRLAANRPGISVRGFFELPVFASYADAAAAGHAWGAVIAYNGDIRPGDRLRICGSATDGANSPGWLTNANTGVAAKLAPYADEALAIVYEFDSGPVFDGLLEWVQFDNPFEFEHGMGFWTGDPADDGANKYRGSQRAIYRDPSSSTGFSYGPGPDSGVPVDALGNPIPGAVAEPYGMTPFDPRLQDPWFRDAMGIPNLTDGANWQSYQTDRFNLNNTPPPAGGRLVNSAGQIVINLFYYSWAGVGHAMIRATQADSTPAAPLGNVDITVGSATGSDLQTYLQAAGGGGGTETVAVADDGNGTITVTISNPRAIDYGQVELYFLARGQVAGVPVNIDIARCIGMVRFQLLVV